MEYNTLSEAITDSQKRVCTENLNLQSNCTECKDLNYKLYVNQFVIDEIHRFESNSNPDESSIFFAISSTEFSLEGLLIDAYGAFADSLNAEMIQKLKYKS